MDYQVLIPIPDAIPAPAWLFILLEQLLFLLHIIVINAVMGGALLLLFQRLLGKDNQQIYEPHQPLIKKLPVLIALGINFGIPPLLFLQVVFGHLFYSSSVLMATYWILIIPLLVIAYYGAYIHAGKYLTSPWFSKISLALASVILLYIGFMLVNNNALMEQPESWTAYFENRGGNILLLSNPALLPRYLHFVAASVAIGGLFFAIVYNYMKDVSYKEKKITNGLKVFAIATAFQIIIGFWYLLAIPQDFMLQFMGQNLIATVVLMFGILTGISGMVFGFLGKFKVTLIHVILTLILMIVTRYNLRMMYLNDDFQLSQLQLSPQYGILILFLVVLLAGLVAIAYMLKVGFKNTDGRVAS
jgi:hypothetical protein